MKKTIILGWCKIDGEEKRRKAIVEVELRLNDKGKICLSMCGAIKKFSYGQCREEIEKYIVEHRENFHRIMEIWKEYHLNDMHAGTPKQEQFVKKYMENNPYDFETICEEMKKAGIYEDNGYRYGSAWLYEEIPSYILDEIFKW